MHPILATPRRFGLYLFVFLQAGVLLAELMVRGEPAPRLQVWAITVPLMLVHAWSCLASWYLCRSTSLDETRPAQLAGVHLTAAAVAGTLLLGVGTAWSRLLANEERFRQGALLFAENRILVFVFAVLLFSLAVAVHYVLLALAASQAAEKRAYELRILAQEAELKMLRTQIDPHFLFNSLNSIASLVVSDAAKARQMCLGLGDFLRRSLRLGAREEIPLADEIALVESYLAVERIRFGDRLRFVSRIADGVGEYLVPPLLLQPLVENAVRHGIANLVEPGQVTLEAEARGGRILLAVENDYDAESPPRRGSGIGLANVRRRLAARYAAAATVDVEKTAATFRVRIAMPARSRAS